MQFKPSLTCTKPNLQISDELEIRQCLEEAKARLEMGLLSVCVYYLVSTVYSLLFLQHYTINTLTQDQ